MHHQFKRVQVTFDQNIDSTCRSRIDELAKQIDNAQQKITVLNPQVRPNFLRIMGKDQDDTDTETTGPMDMSVKQIES